MFSPPHLSLIQFAVFPVLLATLTAASVRTVRVPRIFLGFALVGAVTAFVIAYSFPADPAAAVMITTLKGDDYQSKSRMFREKINSYLHRRSTARAVGFHRVVDSYSEAAPLMLGNRLGLVVWGNDRWINISFPNTPALAVSDFSSSFDSSRLSKLQLVTAIPNVGLSYEPRNETADYIAGLAAGLLPEGSPLAALEAEDFGRRELTLMDAGNIAGKWTAGAHRALPWWILGNLYSYRILRSDVVELGELRCAIAAYSRARSFLLPNDRINADLWSAVNNNLAVMMALKGFVESQPKVVRRARKLLTTGAKIGHMPNVFHLDVRPGTIAKQNVHVLRSFIQKKPHHKKKKKADKKQ